MHLLGVTFLVDHSTQYTELFRELTLFGECPFPFSYCELRPFLRALRSCSRSTNLTAWLSDERNMWTCVVLSYTRMPCL